MYIIAEHLSARQLIRECSEISTLVCIYIYIYICGSVTLKNAIIKHTTTGMLIRRPCVLLMAYCSNVETSEEPTSEGATAHLQRLATLRRRSNVRELQKRPRQKRN